MKIKVNSPSYKSGLFHEYCSDPLYTMNHVIFTFPCSGRAGLIPRNVASATFLPYWAGASGISPFFPHEKAQNTPLYLYRAFRITYTLIEAQYG